MGFVITRVHVPFGIKERSTYMYMIAHGPPLHQIKLIPDKSVTLQISGRQIISPCRTRGPRGVWGNREQRDAEGLWLPAKTMPNFLQSLSDVRIFQATVRHMNHRFRSSDIRRPSYLTWRRRQINVINQNNCGIRALAYPARIRSLRVWSTFSLGLVFHFRFNT